MEEDAEMLPKRIRGIKDEIVRKLCVFFDSEDFTSALEEFCLQNCSTFSGTSCGKEEASEQSLQHTELHQRYLELLEKQLDKFQEQEGIAPEAVFERCVRNVCILVGTLSTFKQSFLQLNIFSYRRCKEAVGEDEFAANFIKMLQAGTSYLHFANLMRDMSEC
ncbi:hypothetical protein CYMTET_48425 [Cymbomonas tetramitiformis]|uniref:Cilia- and flagella-associated protein 36 n=1 Tax=Cymbomonas tetramitiformis TaxID=36881 RepID=A0AAE0BSA0_9CHLO|nr:hypothetical protein CYMTET_48425 [Cymbomonas tetramitiformis]